MSFPPTTVLTAPEQFCTAAEWMVRYGTVGTHPVHSEAGAMCWWGVYEQVAVRTRDHLAYVHGVGNLKVLKEAGPAVAFMVRALTGG